jgi:type III restriction enzyme
MVKLPVFVKNHTDKADLLVNAIGLQQQLERRAKASEKAKEAPYLRPIVLLQAQTKGSNNDATFQQIKKNLIDLGIPENQIAIKTAEIDELKKWPNLQSKECPIRYIITINALKEGWDAPFAYILASMANRSSSVEVEQILGRVLRLPGAKRHPQEALNCSYVFTASASFSNTLQNIVEGLNQAGFSENDYRLAETKPALAFPAPKPVHFATPEAEEQAVTEKIAAYAQAFQSVINEDLESTAQEPTESIANPTFPIFSEVDQILQAASAQEFDLFSKVQKQAAAGIAPLSEEERKMKKTYKINDQYADEVAEISLPQFFFSDPNISLSGVLQLANMRERMLNTVDLLGGGGDDTKKFKLGRADANIDFESAKLEMVQIDIQKTANNDYTPVYKEFSKREALAFQAYINEAAPDRQNKLIAAQLTQALKQLNVPSSTDVKNYVLRVVESLSPNQLEFVKLNPELATKAIKEKIENLKVEHMEKAFFQMIETEKIYTKPSFNFQIQIPLTMVAEPLPRYSLYSKEGSINGLEREFVDKVSALDNVLCWHRNLQVGTGFHINGCYLNHYPDFIVITKRKNVFVVETKGDHLKNEETIRKIKIGNKWAELAGQQFKYFMVFKNRPLEGSKSIADVIEIIESR